MSVQKLVNDTLKLSGVPVAYQRYKGTENTYITFFFFNEYGKAWSDDEEIQTVHSIQVDLWSDGSLSVLTKVVKDAMKEKGFKRTMIMDGFEDGTEINRKIMRFNYFESTQ